MKMGSFDIWNAQTKFHLNNKKIQRKERKRRKLDNFKGFFFIDVCEFKFVLIFSDPY